jgi:hypothetical protein
LERLSKEPPIPPSITTTFFISVLIPFSLFSSEKKKKKKKIFGAFLEREVARVYKEVNAICLH